MQFAKLIVTPAAQRCMRHSLQTKSRCCRRHSSVAVDDRRSTKVSVRWNSVQSTGKSLLIDSRKANESSETESTTEFSTLWPLQLFFCMFGQSQIHCDLNANWLCRQSESDTNVQLMSAEWIIRSIVVSAANSEWWHSMEKKAEDDYRDDDDDDEEKKKKTADADSWLYHESFQFRDRISNEKWNVALRCGYITSSWQHEYSMHTTARLQSIISYLALLPSADSFQLFSIRLFRCLPHVT